MNKMLASDSLAKKRIEHSSPRKEWGRNIIAALTFFFFVSIALNPSVRSGDDTLTIYLYWITPFFDYGFIGFIRTNVIEAFRKQSRRLSFILLCMAAILLFGGIVVVLKVLTLLFGLAYLIYCMRNGLIKWLFIMLNINVLIAIVQFCGYYLISPEFAYSIGPTEVAGKIWHQFSTETFTNFYSITGGFIRVSGWSREGGFFSSLLVMGASLSYLIQRGRDRIIQLGICAIGIALSLSKSSILLLALGVILLFEKKINRLPASVTSIFVVAILFIGAVIGDKLGLYTVEQISIAQRIGSPIALLSFSPEQLAFGAQSLSEVAHPSYLTELLSESSLTLTGFAGSIQIAGFIALFVFLVMFHAIGLRSAGFAFVFISAITTDLFTSTSFIVLAFFCALLLSQPAHIGKTTKLAKQND